MSKKFRVVQKVGVPAHFFKIWNMRIRVQKSLNLSTSTFSIFWYYLMKLFNGNNFLARKIFLKLYAGKIFLKLYAGKFFFKLYSVKILLKPYAGKIFWELYADNLPMENICWEIRVDADSFLKGVTMARYYDTILRIQGNGARS